jgi:hypothetical protein
MGRISGPSRIEITAGGALYTAAIQGLGSSWSRRDKRCSGPIFQPPEQSSPSRDRYRHRARTGLHPVRLAHPIEIAPLEYAGFPWVTARLGAQGIAIQIARCHSSAGLASTAPRIRSRISVGPASLSYSRWYSMLRTSTVTLYFINAHLTAFRPRTISVHSRPDRCLCLVSTVRTRYEVPEALLLCPLTFCSSPDPPFRRRYGPWSRLKGLLSSAVKGARYVGGCGGALLNAKLTEHR